MADGRVTFSIEGDSSAFEAELAKLGQKAQAAMSAAAKAAVQCSCVRSLSATTTVRAYGSCSQKVGTANAQYITAVRIA